YVQVDPPTSKGLVCLVSQLIQFQEDAFGKQVQKSALTRLPQKFFLDFKPGGALCHILAAVYKFRTQQGWRRFDFTSPVRTERNVEMFVHVERALVASGLLPVKKVYVRTDVDRALVPALRDVVARHKGVVVDAPDEATHIIYPPPTTPPE
ncbi:PREDICTED: SWI/SNF complex subunit SMARCC1-like, partial [Priapulus caudatus]|uniref:SWI/SNF complex subunit SMARCC1-like n=1 Tax=Priapulus caudatus TaxID=37621 RepID=A0ABM1F7C6_PRICU